VPATEPPHEPRQPALDARHGILAAIVIVLLVGVFFIGRAIPFEPHLPPVTTSVVEMKPTPNVIMAVRDLARLETADYHIERVIELTDKQTHLFGLFDAKDALLLVAAGDVVAGVDLERVHDEDVRIEEIDGGKRRVHLRLPPPEIFSVAIDNARTHVVHRTTDTLATRKEGLEGMARQEAESSMRKAAAEGGILDRARRGAERSLRELLRALGFDGVEIEWRAD
jgi:hypothetical protein